MINIVKVELGWLLINVSLFGGLVIVFLILVMLLSWVNWFLLLKLIGIFWILFREFKFELIFRSKLLFWFWNWLEEILVLFCWICVDNCWVVRLRLVNWVGLIFIVIFFWGILNLVIFCVFGNVNNLFFNNWDKWFIIV